MIILSIVLFGLLIAAWLIAPNSQPEVVESVEVDTGGLQPETQIA